jgi:hypothetical protein
MTPKSLLRVEKEKMLPFSSNGEIDNIIVNGLYDEQPFSATK